MKPSNEPFLLKASFISFSLASVIVVSAFSASAEDVIYLTGSKGYSTSFASAKWSEKADDPTVRDYLVANGYYFANKSGETVPAKSLTIGVVGGTTGCFSIPYAVTFAEGSEGLVLANGTCQTRYAGAQVITGPVRVTAPAETPFVFNDISIHDGNKPYRRGGVELKTSLSGDSTAGIEVVAYTNDYVFKVSGDASKYYGSVVLKMDTKFGAPDPSSQFVLAGAAFGGSVTCTSNTTFKTVSGDSPCTVKSLTLEAGAILSLGTTVTIDELVLEDAAGLTLQIDANAGTSSTHFTVKDTFAFAGERLKINLTGSPSRSSVLAATADPVSIPLLTVPNTLDLDDFALPDFVVNGKNPLFKMVENGQTKTLTAVYYPYITGVNKVYGGGNLKVAEATVNDSISAGTWADELPMHGDAYYVQEKVAGTTAFLTPFDLEKACLFPGVGLIFGATTALTLQGVEFDVPVISFLSSLAITGLYSPAQVQTLKFGEMTIAGNQTITLNFRGASTVVLKGPIHGGDTTTILVTGNDGSTSSCETFDLLDGDNRKFTGKIKVHTAANRATEDRGVTTLYVKDGKNLGGARSEFAYDALSINNKGILKVIDSATLDEPTRGIYFDSSVKLTDSKAGVNCVRLSVTNETGMLTIKETITLNGTIRKTGAGALALGGALKFLDANTNLTDTVPARADLHGLIMTGGQLKPLAARSMDGLDIVFSNKVSKLAVGLTIDAATTDAELAQRGLIDLKTENNPIVAVTQSGTIPVTFENLPATDSNEAFTV